MEDQSIETLEFAKAGSGYSGTRQHNLFDNTRFLRRPLCIEAGPKVGRTISEIQKLLTPKFSFHIESSFICDVGREEKYINIHLTTKER